MTLYSHLDWRRLFMAVPFIDEFFRFDAFLGALGQVEMPNEWLLASDSDPDTHMHVSLDERGEPEEPALKRQGDPGAKEGESGGLPKRYLFDLRAYASPPAPSEDVPDHIHVVRSDYKSFFEALAKGFGAPERSLEEIRFITQVVLRFTAEHAAWRLPLLEDPPTLVQLPSEMGSVSLAGVRLRFEEAPIGLLGADLDAGMEDGSYRLALTFSSSIAQSELVDMLEMALARTDSLASLFLDYQLSDEVAGKP